MYGIYSWRYADAWNTGRIDCILLVDMGGFTMSRSYKHTPVYKVGGITKYAKRQANKKVRSSVKSNIEDAYSGKSNYYRREYGSWYIWDYRFWGEPIWREESPRNIEQAVEDRLFIADEWDNAYSCRR